MNLLTLFKSAKCELSFIKMIFIRIAGNQNGDKGRRPLQPLLWLGQFMLRRKAGFASHPFAGWADQERGRREMLRRRAPICKVN